MYFKDISFLNLVIKLTQLNRPWAGKEYANNFYLSLTEKITSLWFTESGQIDSEFLISTAVHFNVGSFVIFSVV